MGVIVAVVALDFLWCESVAGISQSWVSLALIAGLLFFTVIFSGWAFLYEISAQAGEA